ncbi:DUF4013 domain-containing protein [Methanobacterium sp.]|uniref:DUF4013 domain-containing protein n=1 Tax=Methanobacterium sp. TaxID=2164 RepID=UPI002ABA6EA4|nr:DUF4013 domain-containing protein [Methanobacterium sp.]MDY9924037.1 DUF4013 domain-containing protein [Methanobacterium sp.]
MNFSQVFKDAVSFPFTDIKKFLKVFLLYLGSFLIIPGLMALGYSLRVIQSTIVGSDELPDFDDSGKLISDGLNLVGANIVYGIPSYVVILLLIISGTLNFATNLFSIMALAIVGFIIDIVFLLALANMAFEDRFRAAFDFKKVFVMIKKIGWGTYLSYLIVYTIIVQVLSLFITFANPYLITMIGSIGGLALYILIYLLFNTFMILFGGRFRGLIYLKGIEDQNEY